jgi:hypothetical protein
MKKLIKIVGVISIGLMLSACESDDRARALQ